MSLPVGWAEDAEVGVIHRLENTTGLGGATQMESAVHGPDHEVEPA